VVLELDPGMAFGTGLHPSTQMCLQAIEKHMSAGSRVLDLGTGSGILAVAAAKLGAGSVLALDVDAVAVEAARENAARNHVDDRIQVEIGSLDRAASGAFDFALVNILASVIIQVCQAGLAQKISPGGLVAFAGLIDTQEEEVRETLEQVGLNVIDRIQDKDWIGLVCRRESSATD
jgi:ribosomal protein L11 methyltransferase